MNTLLSALTADGKRVNVLCDSAGRLVTSEGVLASSSLANSTAYEASHVVKASPGTLILLSGYNFGPEQFIQLHDADDLPADGVAPVMTLIVGEGQNFSFDIPISGLPLASGIVVCNSSTGDTKTLGSANVYFTAVFL